MNVSHQSVIFPQLLIRQQRPLAAAARFHGITLPTDAAAEAAFYHGLTCVGWVARQLCQPQQKRKLDEVLALGLQTLRDNAALLATVEPAEFETVTLKVIQENMAKVYGSIAWEQPGVKICHEQTEDEAQTPRLPVILLAEDDPVSRFQICAELRKAGFDPRPVESGAEAMLTTPILQPDLILLDVSMEQVCGMQACAWLKASRLAGQPPIIFLSGDDTDEAVGRAFAAGGVEFIGKPFDRHTGVARIHTQLEIRRLQHEVEFASQLRASIQRDTQPKRGHLMDSRNSSPALPGMSAGVGNITLSPFERTKDLTAPARALITPDYACKDLAPLLRLVAWIYKPTATNKLVQLQLNAPEANLVAVCDEILLQRFLENLLSDAIKSAQPDTRITIGACREDDRIRLWMDQKSNISQIRNSSESGTLFEFTLPSGLPSLATTREISTEQQTESEETDFSNSSPATAEQQRKQVEVA